MNIKRIIAATAAAMLITAGAASADDHNMELTDFDNPRYNFNLTTENQMIFKNPVSFTGEVIDADNSHRTVEAANGMTVKIPNQALLWNGDREMFSQSTNIGDEVVVHLRPEEGYRIMNEPKVNDPWVAVGSYEGVFYFPKDFIRDFALNDLDSDIYADGSMLDEEDIAYDNNDPEAVVVTEDMSDGDMTMTTINVYDDDDFNGYNRYDVDLKSVEQ